MVSFPRKVNFLGVKINDENGNSNWLGGLLIIEAEPIPIFKKKTFKTEIYFYVDGKKNRTKGESFTWKFAVNL